jgi:hypothetical protein
MACIESSAEQTGAGQTAKHGKAHQAPHAQQTAWCTRRHPTRPNKSASKPGVTALLAAEAGPAPALLLAATANE